MLESSGAQSALASPDDQLMPASSDAQSVMASSNVQSALTSSDDQLLPASSPAQSVRASSDSQSVLASSDTQSSVRRRMFSWCLRRRMCAIGSTVGA